VILILIGSCLNSTSDKIPVELSFLKKRLILRREIVYNRHASFTLTPDIPLFQINPLTLSVPN
jgi:hypothetical protein